MPAKIPLFIDFDRVLFDTDCLRDSIYDVIIGAGYSAEIAIGSYREASGDRQYLPEKQVAILQAIQPEIQIVPEELVTAIYAVLSNLLYPDAEQFLQSLNREGYTVELVTLGNPGFQEKKIELTGIRHFFDQVQICTVEKWEYLQDIVGLDQAFIIIDDRLDTIQAIEERYPKSYGIFKDYKNEYPTYAGTRSCRVVTLAEMLTLTFPEPFPSLAARQP